MPTSPTDCSYCTWGMSKKSFFTRTTRVYLFGLSSKLCHNTAENKITYFLTYLFTVSCYLRALSMVKASMTARVSKRSRPGTGRIFYGHYRFIFNHCDIIGLKICRIRWKKTQNKGYYGVQGYSRSSRSVPIESPYATSYQ